MTTTLFTPLTLKNGFTIKNRFMKAATSETMGDPNNRPTPELANLYRTWAKGGTGLIITGNVMVDDTAKGEYGNVVVEDNRDLDTLKRWAHSVTDNDAAIFMQLNHPGKQSPKTLSKTPVSPSAVPVGGPNGFAFNVPRALTHSEIKDIIQEFGNAALVAKKADFSGVEIHGAHGYLINQFLSPHDNQRVDEYGGSLENRMRFLEEVYQDIREKVGPDYPIALKINSSDLSPDGFSESDSVKVIQKMDKLGIDLIEISGGNYENTEIQGIGKGAFFIDYAQKIKHLITAPIAVTGGFQTAEGMKNAIDSDGTDIVGLARPLVIMPDIPNLMEMGRFRKVDLHYLTTGLKPLDKKVGPLVGLSFYHLQMDRTAHGKSIQQNTESAWGALGFAFKRQGLTVLMPQRG